jgi:hypothetical protein
VNANFSNDQMDYSVLIGSKTEKRIHHIANSCTRLGKIRFPARGAFDFAAEQRKLHCKVVIQRRDT